MFKQKGFTLIELLVVISIIGILSGLIAIGMSGATTAAQDSKKKATVDSIKKSLVIDKVDTGTYPIEAGCTIGIDCANLDPVLLQYLPADLGATYTYESDGTGCTVSTILSNGHVYQYDCLTSTYSSNMPVNGACGSSNGANLSSIPLTNLCNQGNVSTVTGAGPWTWTCIGLNTGTTASCATGGVPVNGVCGSSNGANLTSIPSTNLCTAGTSSSVIGSGPWTWTCAGSSGGVSPSCSANLIVNGACGSSNGADLNSIPSTNLCSLGNATTVTGTGPWTWSCTGLNGGSSSSTCSARKSCSALGGTLTTCGSTTCCQITGPSSGGYVYPASCPEGWTYVTGWYEGNAVPNHTPFYGSACSLCGSGCTNYYADIVPWGYHSTECEGGVVYCSGGISCYDGSCAGYSTFCAIHTGVGCR